MWVVHYYCRLYFSCLASKNVTVFSDLGHSRPGEISVIRSGFLPWCWWLCSCFWCYHAKHFSIPGQLEGWVSYSSISQRPWELPICCHWKQDWFGKQGGKFLYIRFLQDLFIKCGGRFLCMKSYMQSFYIKVRVSLSLDDLWNFLDAFFFLLFFKFHFLFECEYNFVVCPEWTPGWDRMSEKSWCGV